MSHIKFGAFQDILNVKSHEMIVSRIPSPFLKNFYKDGKSQEWLELKFPEYKGITNVTLNFRADLVLPVGWKCTFYLDYQGQRYEYFGKDVGTFQLGLFEALSRFMTDFFELEFEKLAQEKEEWDHPDFPANAIMPTAE